MTGVLEKAEARIKSGTYRKTIIYTFLFSSIAHLYRFTNSAFIHDSLLINQIDYGWQISLGRYIIPVYVRLRGPITAPLLIGFLSICFLSVSIAILSEILKIKDNNRIVLLCGILSTCRTITVANASFLFVSDIYMLSLLFSVIAVLTIQFKFGWVASSICIALSMGLYPAYIETFITVFLIWIILLTIKDSNDYDIGKYFSRFIIALVLGGTLYYLGWKYSMAVSMVQPANTTNSITGAFTLLQRAKDVPRLALVRVKQVAVAFLKPISYGRLIICLSNILIRLISFFHLFFSNVEFKRKAIAIGLLIMFPLCANFISILSNGYVSPLMSYAFYMAYPICLMIIGCLDKELFKGEKKVVSVLMLVIVCQNIIYSNQLYLQKDLEYQSTMSTMTRIITQMENVDGYISGETVVVIEGDINNSQISMHRDGYIDDSEYAVNYYGAYENFFRNVLGYPINLGKQYMCDEYAEMQEVIDMPSFPQKGCCRMVGDVMVVKLSDNMFLRKNQDAESNKRD